MAKDIVTKAEILGGEIDVSANFGQTVKVTVSPDPYMGETEVTPTDQTQVLATKKKFVQDDITVYPAPTETLLTTLNGTFTPSDGKVGFSAVSVDVNPDLRPLSVSENGTYEPDGFDGYSDVTVDVDVAQKWDINDFVDNTFVFENGVVNLDTATIISRNVFNGNKSIKSVYAPFVESVEGGFYDCLNLEDVYFPKLKTTIGQCFRNTKLGDNFHEKFPVIETIGDRTFQNCLFATIHLPETVKVLSARGFNNCFNLKTVYFHSKPTTIGNAFDTYLGRHITDIYVPWSEGEVSGAPWGATGATVHYNTVCDENWNVISST